jgi:ABC-2 type transport system ATP-binding protein
MADAIVVEDLRKSFGKTQALDGLSLAVAEGTVMGLLGPNGAGKTTTVRVLATLLRPDSGRALVCGEDVLAAPRRVRPLIGLTGQYTAVDELLTGLENLELIGQLARLTGTEARRRAAELIERFDLADAAKRQVKTYSGGMRRRLDLAASLIGRPRVLFLDEPTTGLDLRSRLSVWAAVRDLTRQGTTVLLTTQYLEEADRLSDAITVIDSGRVVVSGSPADLKRNVGGDRVELALGDPGQLGTATEIVDRLTGNTGSIDEEAVRVTVPLPDGDAGVVPEMLRLLHEADVTIVDLAVRHPTLDDVFLSMTGRPAESATAGPATAGPATAEAEVAGTAKGDRR